MFTKKFNTLSLGLFAVAFILCGIAWMRFFWAAGTNPSPVRYVDFVTPDGPRDPFRQICAGPAFVDGGAIWRYCAYDEQALDPAVEGPWGLVRFDLERGRADLFWPLPFDRTVQILGLTRSPAGDLAVAWGVPELAAITHIRPEGGVEALGVPTSDSSALAGIAWRDTALDVVTLREGEAARYRYQDGAWGPAQPIRLPEACGADSACTLQVAFSLAEGWRFLYTQLPPQAGADAALTLLLAEESGALVPQDAPAIPLGALAESQVTREGETLVKVGALFDRSPGNVINWEVAAPPLRWTGQGWIATPPLDAESAFYFSDYAITPEGLEWIPGVRYPQRAAWIGDRWLALRLTEHGVALAVPELDMGPVLTGSTVFLAQGGTLTALLPRAAGGYWVLGPHGAYLQVDRDLSRADGLNLAERIRRAFENFGRLKVYNDDFYRQQTFLKMLALPLVLLSLPAGYLLVFFLRRSRRETRAWLGLLARVSAVYLILATIFMWWFWEAMHSF